jgi:poly(hydroxyalkanoate) granule-associated protein
MDTSTKDAAKKLQDELADSAHRIWLAGLGALAAAQEEGSKVFDRLVERGKDVESKGKDQAGKARETVREKAETAWSTVGDRFDDTLTSALSRLGVPSREEIRNLTQKIEELNAKVEQLKQPRPAAPPTVAGTPQL